MIKKIIKQVKMGKSYDAKTLLWKQEVESHELKIAFWSYREAVETVVDMSQATLREYNNFSLKGFERCATLLDQSAFSGEAPAKDIKKILAMENSKDRKIYRWELFRISQGHNHTTICRLY